MKLEYRILWIDDQIEDYIDMGIKEELIAHLDNLAFKADIDCFETAELAEEKLKTKDYDLILSDYNIDGSKSGKELIDGIRDGEIFTEILFYSAKPDFDNVAKSLYRDRVSYLSLVDDDGFRKFRKQVTRLIDLTVKKLQELNSVRGLVMSHTSDLDTTIEDILIELMGNDDEISGQLREYAIKKIKENLKGKVKEVEKIEDLGYTDLVKNRLLFDANKKSRTLNQFLKLSRLSDEDDFKNFHENYETEVLAVRNDLAHAKSAVIDGTEYLIVSRKDGDQPVKYDQNRCIDIRKKLRKYSDLLQKIRERIVEND